MWCHPSETSRTSRKQQSMSNTWSDTLNTDDMCFVTHLPQIYNTWEDTDNVWLSAPYMITSLLWFTQVGQRSGELVYYDIISEIWLDEADHVLCQIFEDSPMCYSLVHRLRTLSSFACPPKPSWRFRVWHFIVIDALLKTFSINPSVHSNR